MTEDIRYTMESDAALDPEIEEIRIKKEDY